MIAHGFECLGVLWGATPWHGDMFRLVLEAQVDFFRYFKRGFKDAGEPNQFGSGCYQHKEETYTRSYCCVFSHTASCSLLACGDLRSTCPPLAQHLKWIMGKCMWYYANAYESLEILSNELTVSSSKCQFCQNC